MKRAMWVLTTALGLLMGLTLLVDWREQVDSTPQTRPTAEWQAMYDRIAAQERREAEAAATQPATRPVSGD